MKVPTITTSTRLAQQLDTMSCAGQRGTMFRPAPKPTLDPDKAKELGEFISHLIPLGSNTWLMTN